jgi:uncharacterized protein (TIGR02300 family)
MVKPEWGAKRICPSCGAVYYDMLRDPIVCPKCGANYDPEAVLKSRRTRAAAAEERELPVAAVEAEIDPEALPADDLDDADAIVAEEDEDEADAIMEDTSELGEDDDDMAEVIEHIEEEDDR